MLLEISTNRLTLLIPSRAITLVALKDGEAIISENYREVVSCGTIQHVPLSHRKIAYSSLLIQVAGCRQPLVFVGHREKIRESYEAIAEGMRYSDNFRLQLFLENLQIEAIHSGNEN